MSAVRAVSDSRTGAAGSADGAVESAAALPAVRPVVSIAPAATAVARARVVRLWRAKREDTQAPSVGDPVGVGCPAGCCEVVRRVTED